jgi:Homeodomain-like domain
MVSACEDVRAELRRRANGRSNEHWERFRAEIILLRLEGIKIEDVAARMKTSMRTVSIWSSLYERDQPAFFPEAQTLGFFGGAGAGAPAGFSSQIACASAHSLAPMMGSTG